MYRHRRHSDFSDYSSASDQSKDRPPVFNRQCKVHSSTTFTPKMHRHRRHSDCSDYSSVSDQSKDRPPVFKCQCKVHSSTTFTPKMYHHRRHSDCSDYSSASDQSKDRLPAFKRECKVHSSTTFIPKMHGHRRHSDCSDYSSASDQSKDRPPVFKHECKVHSSTTFTPKMDHHRRHLDCSDYSSVSDQSKDRPPVFNCDGIQPEDIQRKPEVEFKRRIEELWSEFDRNHQPLIDQIKELNEATDELESVHRNTTVGSLVGSSIGAAGGIAAIAGVCLAPFTLGASLALTVGGGVAGVAGGGTSVASNTTNMIKQKNLREAIEKIIKDFQNTVNPMIELLNRVHDIAEDIELNTKTIKKYKFQREEKNADILKFVSVAGLAQVGKICAEAAKELRVYVKAVNAARGPAWAAKAAGAVAGVAKEIRVASAVAGGLSALFLALDVYCIVQDSVELSEMNQPADKRKAEDIKSETLKYILQMREMADQFKKIVDKITDTIDTFNPFLAER